jgi:methionine-S-sulfoxide reductase
LADLVHAAVPRRSVFGSAGIAEAVDDEVDDSVAHGWQASLRRWSVDFFPPRFCEAAMLKEGADETSTPARGAGVVTSTNIGYDVQARDIRARLVQRYVSRACRRAAGVSYFAQTADGHRRKLIKSGYAGGEKKTAHYEMVGSSTTGHAESVRITFDASKISYGRILQIYFSVAHDPTQLNRQGPDVGTQYRSAIFSANAEQARVAKAYIAQLNQARVYPAAIVTKIEPDRELRPKITIRIS